MENQYVAITLSKSQIAHFLNDMFDLEDENFLTDDDDRLEENFCSTVAPIIGQWYNGVLDHLAKESSETIDNLDGISEELQHHIETLLFSEENNDDSIQID